MNCLREKFDFFHPEAGKVRGKTKNVGGKGRKHPGEAIAYLTFPPPLLSGNVWQFSGEELVTEEHHNENA